MLHVLHDTSQQFSELLEDTQEAQGCHGRKKVQSVKARKC